MWITVIRRIITSVVTIFFCSVLVFVLRYLLPGGPIEDMALGAAGSGTISHKQILALEEQFGLNHPIAVQYLDWLRAAVHGDLGISFFTGVPVSSLIVEHAAPSLELILASLAISTTVGVPLGVYAAVKRQRKFGPVFLTLTGLGISLPDFWVATMLAAVVGLDLGILPAIGYTSISQGIGPNIRTMILPTLSLSIVAIAFISRHVYNAMSQVLGSPFVRTAWAMGLPARTVYIRWALRNSLVPVVTFLPLAFTSLIGGTVVVEYVFNIPGLGTEIVTAVTQEDYPVVQGLILLAGVAVALVNLIGDLAVGMIDPRTR
jgi:peptide/nickel transport system permease protein